jgi:microsomal dipeptidase-like Zn-dependent dipeptidase
VTLVLVPAPALGHPGHDHGNPTPVVSGGCYLVRSAATGGYLTRAGGKTYAAQTADAGDAEPFRVQATGLDRYMLLDRRQGVLSEGPVGGLVATDAAAGGGDWSLNSEDGNSFTMTHPTEGVEAMVDPRGGQVSLAKTQPGRALSRFAVEPAADCAKAPEIDTSTHGQTYRGKVPYGQVQGFLDTHVHGMAFEFLGGGVHCGRPFSSMGVTVALTDCPDHVGNGAGAVLENFLSTGLPVGFHDPVGWPTFKDWPRHDSLTHEQTYYKWMERAWKGGLRIQVNLFVENEVLCDVYPIKRNPCNDMDSIRLQAKDAYEMQDYIDAQNGGPGKGWYRIVTSPFEARRVINDGKLAVVLGVEVSEPFGCNVYNDVPQCNEADIDSGLDEFHKLGIRDMELVNKFDNALGGVAFDSGATGVVINTANKLKTGQFWQAQKCTGDVHDHSLTPGLPDDRDRLLGAGLLLSGLPSGLVPVYPSGPDCNTRGLSSLGAHAVEGLMQRHMIIDPDHLSVLARSQALSIVEAHDYSGVVSSHSWSDPEADARILHSGGVIGPYAGNSTSYVDNLERLRKIRDPRYLFGVGFGPDMNGFGAQGGPRPGNEKNPVKYPFKSFDGGVTFDRQQSGSRVFDINTDGVAHYGMYPDWIEDVRQIAGNSAIRDMTQGPEAYLQMWERAEGVPGPGCLDRRVKLDRGSVDGVKPGLHPEKLLMSAGQPQERDAQSWGWCANGKGKAEVRASLSKSGTVEVVLSSAKGHQAGSISPGDHMNGSGMEVGGRAGKNRVVYRVRGGKVTHVGLAQAAVAHKTKLLNAAAKRALD